MTGGGKHVAVIDIGKTNAKVALVNIDARAEIAVRKRANGVINQPPFPHFDTDGLWQFILRSLGELNAIHPISAITVTTHGASAALLAEDGSLAAPILDYEYSGPDGLKSEYDAARPTFTETGSPRLPMGLNLGAQLFWQFHTFPDIKEATRTILTYPQYWVFRLTGRAVNEVTSLGCHTDLWCPQKTDWSSLVKAEGWTTLMAPVAKAADVIGMLLPELAAAHDLPTDIPVHCGIHDSNASLYAHLARRAPPFAVVSTGTWVISMAIGGKAVALDPHRDTLINVNALGDPVPSARFMGGREFERLMSGRRTGCTAEDIASVLKRGIMLMPSVESHSGPFQGRQNSWTVTETSMTDAERFAAISFYLAMMTAEGLDIAGAEGDILVEGPFSENSTYLDMLTAATGRPVHAVAGTGTSIGAALLTKETGNAALTEKDTGHKPTEELATYARQWRDLVNAPPLPSAGKAANAR